MITVPLTPHHQNRFEGYTSNSISTIGSDSVLNLAASASKQDPNANSAGASTNDMNDNNSLPDLEVPQHRSIPNIQNQKDSYYSKEPYYPPQPRKVDLLPKRFVVALVAAGSISLLILVFVGAFLPRDDEFSSSSSTSTTTTTSSTDAGSSISNPTSSAAAAVANFTSIMLPPPPEDIEKVCAPKFLDTMHGFSICQAICQPSHCCLVNSEKEGSCIDEHREKCGIYHDPCKPIFASSGAASKAVHGAKPNITDEKSLSNICNSQKLTSTDGRNLCLDACSPALCCFEESSSGNNTTDENCYNNETKIWCDMFTACEIIFNENLSLDETNPNQGKPSPMKKALNSIKTVCSQAYTDINGFDTCEEVCRSDPVFEVCVNKNSGGSSSSPGNNDTNRLLLVHVEDRDERFFTRVLDGANCTKFEPCSVIFGDSI